MEKFLEALKEDKAYDYLCNHGHEMTKDELINIAKEFIFSIHWVATSNGVKYIEKEVAEDVIEELSEE